MEYITCTNATGVKTHKLYVMPPTFNKVINNVLHGKPFSRCLCGFEIESINQYCIYCPLFDAPRLKLVSSAPHIFDDRWSYVGIADNKASFAVTGSSQLSDGLRNIEIFTTVQRFTYVKP